ncbi:hypothetical protein MUK42_02374 [Musa troglodytarum]|uniref:Uncharacterized protein n=1 Tax=Musa troglodytarum TaxID=320322 RepID=A0A9E7JFN9_9LILI|nr:hypothetical protein MUK42_02374 [Musa troglodytarum]
MLSLSSSSSSSLSSSSGTTTVALSGRESIASVRGLPRRRCTRCV